MVRASRSIRAGSATIASLLRVAFQHLHEDLPLPPPERLRAIHALTGAHELSHDRAKALPALDQIGRIDLQRSCVVRLKEKTRFAWARVRTRQIRNSMLLVEELVARKIEVTVPNGVYIPPLKAHVAGSRPAPLPTAKTVQR